MTADRGYGEARVDTALHDLGVRTVAIPARDRPDQPAMPPNTDDPFRRLVKWHTGCEGRIAHLIRRAGWDRTLLDSLSGARIWCGHGVFTHNLTKISALAE